jgi:hypothetical protein
MPLGYYVTIKRGSRTGWLFGPCADHGVALMMVPYIRELAGRIDPFTHFDAFGTSSIDASKLNGAPLPAGVLNGRVGT